MSDTQSQKSSTTNRNKPKVCGIDGKRETSNYFNHNKVHHGGEKMEWDEITDVENPWCSNWREIILNPTVNPIGVRTEFKPSFKAANSNKASRSVCTPSIPAFSQFGDNDVDMENTANEEEKKADVAP